MADIPLYTQPIGTPTVWQLAARDQPEISSVSSGSIYFDTTAGKFMVSGDAGVFVYYQLWDASVP
jgi:hypothetical protein